MKVSINFSTCADTSVVNVWKLIHSLVNKHWVDEQRFNEDFKKSYDESEPEVGSDLAMFSLDQESGQTFFVNPNQNVKLLKLAKLLIDEKKKGSLLTSIKISGAINLIHDNLKFTNYMLFEPITDNVYRNKYVELRRFENQFKSHLVYLKFKKKYFLILVDKRWLAFPRKEIVVEPIKVVKVKPVTLPNIADVQNLISTTFDQDRIKIVGDSPFLAYLKKNKVKKCNVVGKSGYIDIDAVREESKKWISGELITAMNLIMPGEDNEDNVKWHLSGWASSSFSSASCVLQRAAANKFGITISQYAANKLLKHNVPQDLNAGSLFLDKIYERTQKFLKQQNIKQVTLFRGVVLSENHLGKITYFKKYVETNPLNSWSSCVSAAIDFCDDFEAKRFPFVLTCKVPAANIVSTPVTGIGCLSEMEYIITGGDYEVLVDPMVYRWLRESTPIVSDYPGVYPQFRLPNRTKLFNRLPIIRANRIPFQNRNFITNAVTEMLEFYKTNIEWYSIPPLPEQQGKLFDALNAENIFDRLNDPINIQNENIVVAADDQPLRIDEGDNADWCKQSWDLPPYMSVEFLQYLDRSGQSVEEFKQLPVYRHAVKKGLIVNDKWVK